MLPLSEISRLNDTVDTNWRSPIADTVSAAWGYRPGAALYWRSRASHVFVVLNEDRTQREGFLRCVPAHLISRHQVEAVAALMACPAEAGAATVPILRSSTGDLVETIDVGGWHVHATLVANAGGAPMDLDDLTPESAQAWGAALGRLHCDGDVAATEISLPDGPERIYQALTGFDGHAVLGEVAAVVRSRLATMPRNANCYGLIHGDFELDNLAWVDGAPIAYDFDEAERSWFAADIASAIRDLVPEPRALAESPSAVLAAFLAGYRRERPTMVVDLDQLVLFTVVNALRSLTRLGPALTEDPEEGRGLVADVASGPPLSYGLPASASAAPRVAGHWTAHARRTHRPQLAAG
jgi:Ser/Thr protein kinase RdoA (MazF antagonist)